MFHARRPLPLGNNIAIRHYPLKAARFSFRTLTYNKISLLAPIQRPHRLWKRLVKQTLFQLSQKTLSQKHHPFAFVPLLHHSDPVVCTSIRTITTHVTLLTVSIFVGGNLTKGSPFSTDTGRYSVQLLSSTTCTEYGTSAVPLSIVTVLSQNS